MAAIQSQEEKFIHMTQEPVQHLICELAGPTIISMLVTSFYNMADTFFVGQVGTSATGAVGVSFSVMAVIQAFGFFFGHGSGNYVSRKLGAQEFDEAAKMAATGFVSAFIMGLVIMVVGLSNLDGLCRLLGATDTILPYAKDYLRFILIGAPYMTAALVLNNQLRFQGSAFYAMIGIASGGLLNIVLDPIFIFVLDMGVGGAALATIISQFLGFILLVSGTYRDGCIAVRIRNLKPSFYYVREMVQAGFPSLCRQGLNSIATLSLNHMAGLYGDAAIAAMSIVNRGFAFAFSALIGFGQGFQPVCGFNYGAKLYRRVRQGYWFCVRTSVGFLCVLAVLGFGFAPEIISLFRKTDPEVIETGAKALRMQAVVFPLMSLYTISSMMLQAIRKTTKATIMAASRQGIFFLPAILLLPHLLGLTGIQIAQPVSDFFTACLALPLAASELRKMREDGETAVK